TTTGPGKALTILSRAGSIVPHVSHFFARSVVFPPLYAESYQTPSRCVNVLPLTVRVAAGDAIPDLSKPSAADGGADFARAGASLARRSSTSFPSMVKTLSLPLAPSTWKSGLRSFFSGFGAAATDGSDAAAFG